MNTPVVSERSECAIFSLLFWNEANDSERSDRISFVSFKKKEILSLRPSGSLQDDTSDHFWAWISINLSILSLRSDNLRWELS